MNLKPLAYAASKRLKADMTSTEVRDICDQVSGFDLDCTQLDIVQDEAARLKELRFDETTDRYVSMN